MELYPLKLTTDIPSELAQKHNEIFLLNHCSVLRVEGEHAATFLQGQLTCDVAKLTPGSMAPACLCNIQGRIIALMDVVLWQEQYFLVLSSDLVPVVKASLQKVALLSRITFTEMPYFIYGLGIQNTSIPNPLGLKLEKFESFQCVMNDASRFVYAISQQLLICISTEPISDIYPDASRWHMLQLLNNHVVIHSQTSGLFLPHRLMLHEKGFISFDKGCYRGQEIIARTHYRAKLKHTLRILMAHSAHDISLGARLLQPTTHQEIGELVDGVCIAEEKFLIAVSMLLDWEDSMLLMECN